MREHVAAVLAAVVGGIPHDVELYIEQLLEFQSHACPFQLSCVFRVMYCAQGFVASHQVQPCRHELRQRFGQLLPQFLYECLRQPFHHAGCYAFFLHHLGGGVVRLHPHRRQFHRVGRVNVGMDHVYPSVEHRRAPEHHILCAYPVCLLGILTAVEPCQVHHSRTVAEVCHHALLARPHIEGLETEYPAAYLYKGHFAGQFPDCVYTAAVNILVWEVHEHVAVGVDAEFRAQYLLAGRAHTGQKLYVGGLDAPCGCV